MMTKSKNPEQEVFSRPKKPNDWFMYQLFYIVADSKTLFEAERRTGLSFHYISRVIAKLEEALGLKLVIHGRKKVELTVIGKEMFKKLQAAQDNIHEVNLFAARAFDGDLDVPLKMGAPYSLAAALLTPFKDDMTEACPELKMHLDIVQRQDLSRLYEYDCALFPEKPERKNFCAHYLYTSRPGIYASKEYLATKGIPETFDALLTTGDIITSYRKRDFDKPAPEWIKPFENSYDRDCIMAQHIQFILDDVVRSKGFGVLSNGYTLAYPIEEVAFGHRQQEGLPVHFIYPKEHKTYKNIQALRDYLLKLTAPLR